jgi:hypothetical protein
MSFCNHCEGQRFDRARVLRALRVTRKQLQTRGRAGRGDHALVVAIAAARALEITHLESADDPVDGDVVP